MDARFLSSVGLGFGIRIGRSTTLPNTALDKNRFPSALCQNLKTDNFRTNLTNFWQKLVPLNGPLKDNRRDKFSTDLGFGAFLNAVRGKKVRKSCNASSGPFACSKHSGEFLFRV